MNTGFARLKENSFQEDLQAFSETIVKLNNNILRTKFCIYEFDDIFFNQNQILNTMPPISNENLSPIREMTRLKKRHNITEYINPFREKLKASLSQNFKF
jgi:hypothetical protein